MTEIQKLAEQTALISWLDFLESKGYMYNVEWHTDLSPAEMDEQEELNEKLLDEYPLKSWIEENK